MKIAVVMGGNSSEREISLLTGKAVAEALERAGHEVLALDIPDVQAVLGEPLLRDQDMVFPALHGGEGEDGHLQALLDVLGIPYALSGPMASALAMDKAASKRVMRGAGIPTPDWLQVVWDRDSARAGTVSGGGGGRFAGDALTRDHILDRAGAEIGFPLVLKLNTGGSSVGVRIVNGPGEFAEAFTAVAESGSGRSVDMLVEQYIKGRELTAAIFLGRRLPLLEIRPHEGFYDFEHKYTAGANEYLVPAPVHSPLYEEISSDALRLFDLLCCKGMARVDFRVDEGRHYCLEINTIPGMTETSLVPKAAAAVGIGFEDLVVDLCRAAMDAGEK